MAGARLAALAAIAAASAMLGAAQPSAPGAVVKLADWDGAKDGDPKTFHMGGYDLTLSSRPDGERRVPVLSAAWAGAEPVELIGDADHAQASFGVMQLDPSSATPEVLFTTFTGGAHCCTLVQAVELVGGKLVAIPVGEWDGDGYDSFTDEDGDGRPDLVFADDRFNYAFASHADSYLPVQVLELRAGKVVDVSKERRFFPLHQAALEEAEKACGKSYGNGACAAMVAEAAVLGRAEAYWARMLKDYDRQSDWELPAKCLVKLKDGEECPADKVHRFKTYPEALEWFLWDTGYTASEHQFGAAAE